jgi:hypothetical protein
VIVLGILDLRSYAQVNKLNPLRRDDASNPKSFFAVAAMVGARAKCNQTSG